MSPGLASYVNVKVTFSALILLLGLTVYVHTETVKGLGKAKPGQGKMDVPDKSVSSPNGYGPPGFIT
jgi:hypothetical protein